MTMTDEEVLALVPRKAPDGWLEWLKSKGLMRSEYLICQFTSGKKATAKCTCCKGHLYGEKGPGRAFVYGEQKIDPGDRCRCPLCGTECRMSPAGGGDSTRKEWEFFLTVNPMGKPVVLTGWRASRWFDREGNVHTQCEPWEAYLYYRDGRKLRRRKATAHRQLFYNAYSSEWRALKNAPDSWWDCALVAPFGSLADTALENAKIREFLEQTVNGRLIGYLALYGQRQAAENLVTAGFGQLVNEYIRGGWSDFGNPALINWKEKKPLKMLGLERWEAEYWKGSSSKTLGALAMYKNIKKQVGRPIRQDEWELVWKYRVYNVDALAKYGRVLQDLRYLEKQRAKNDRVHIRELLDYFRAMEKLGEDLNDRAVRYPPNLARADARAGARLAEIRDKAMEARFAERLAELTGLAWTADGLSIRPAKSNGELAEEGKLLHHCVGGYGTQHVAGKSIFFIRRATDPDMPYFTLQLDCETGRVLQNRGDHNCARTPEVSAFEARWLAEVVTPWVQARKHTDKTPGAA